MQVFGLAGSRAGSSDESVLLPGVRRRIGQRLARRPQQPRFCLVLDVTHSTEPQTTPVTRQHLAGADRT